MKTVIMNYNGNAGKTTIASFLLKPRMPEDTVFFSVESINFGAADLGIDSKQVTGNQFGKIFEDIVIENNIIVDVGASNIEPFLLKWSEIKGAANEFDFFVIPVTSNNKSILESIRTASLLSQFGIPAQIIRFIPNMIGVSVRDELPELIDYVHTEKKSMA